MFGAMIAPLPIRYTSIFNGDFQDPLRNELDLPLLVADPPTG